MAGKNAYLRYRIIDECLNNSVRRYNRVELLDRINSALGIPVTISTMDKDIKAMKDEFGAPIVWSNANGGYYFYNEEFTMAGIALSDEERDVLNLSLGALNVFKNTKYGKSFKTLVERLYVQEKNRSESFIEWERPVEFLGIEWFDRLVKAIAENTPIRVTYRPYDKPEKNFDISPYFIKEYQNRFYLVGKNHHNDHIMTLGFDRIKEVVELKEKFKFTKGFDRKEYFKHSMGIIRKADERPIKLKLKVSSEDAHYILSNPWHSSQKEVEKTDDYLIFSLEVYDTPELDLKIRSYGAEIEVLEPESYRKKMKETAERMLGIYK